MKKIIYLTLGAILFLGCSKDDNDTQGEITSGDIDAIKSTAQSGEWHVSSYLDSGNDETNAYAGYRFTFGPNGVLGVTDGNTALSGAWSITTSDSDDDSSEDDIDFNIIFNGSELFEELSDDWDMVKYSDAKIELFDVSGGDGTTDYLTFEKM
ncbi:hypothetical protein [Pareuzebyella sediminis]|uniref:hypothetical protein n=1 Tax=Pareuzebyella sediminis TaxID=2607998 RepID=UPI001E2C4F59|nr:hypothetical protein [Pareuzebyella sediminis]